MISIKQQKYLIVFVLLSINTILSTTFLFYPNKWYVYLFLLALASGINAFSAILIIGKHIIFPSHPSNKISKELNLIVKDARIVPRNYVYIIPCYNESEEELRWSIQSLLYQRHVGGDKRALLIICDGKVRGKGNLETTDEILKRMLKIASETSEYYTYTTWDKSLNIITLFYGNIKHQTENVPFILIVKNANYGKRDSLVLARTFCYKYNLLLANPTNLKCNKEENDDSMLLYAMMQKLDYIYNSKIDYIIGIDADTIFDYNCSYELIKSIEEDASIYGCVGLVEVSPLMNKFSFLVLYQYAEYIFAQSLRRYAQANITKKVSCLSGCVQILRIAEETCGEKILEAFNYLPKEEENILCHIRSYASEDRNHVCHMLSMYPYAKTTQNVCAIAYTNVPSTIQVFISQRRRWCLGANANDLMLVYLPGINIFERISSGVNVITFSILPFILIATVVFLKTIVEEPTLLMLYLGIIIIIPLSYGFIIIPLFIRRYTFHQTLYYYLSFICFITFGSIVNLFIYFYALACMDVIKWGKTRSIAYEPPSEPPNDKKLLDILLKNIPEDTDFEIVEHILKNKQENDTSDDVVSLPFSNQVKSITNNNYFFDDLQSVIV
jgi:chitin synthase